MENSTILDSQFSASSENSYALRPAAARLNLEPTSHNHASWRPVVNTNSWLQVDFLKHTRISLILTQGRPNQDFFVTSYLVSYSTNEVDFQFIKEHGRDKVSTKFSSSFMYRGCCIIKVWNKLKSFHGWRVLHRNCIKKSYKRANHAVICLFYVYRDQIEKDKVYKYKNTASNKSQYFLHQNASITVQVLRNFFNGS